MAAVGFAWALAGELLGSERFLLGPLRFAWVLDGSGLGLGFGLCSFYKSGFGFVGWPLPG